MTRRQRQLPRGRDALIAVVLVALLGGAAAHAGGSAKTTKESKSLFEKDPFKKYTDALNKIKEISDKDYKDVKELSPDEPDFDPPDSPQLPSLCKDSSTCLACFEDPYEQLQDTRFRFEKLRKVNRVTKKMLRDSISFGDAAASAAGGLAPLAWNSEKTKIRASEKSFNQSYDDKYEELLATLKEALDGIAACEEKVFDEEGWYERYGFVYQQFMSEAYRRPD